MAAVWSGAISFGLVNIPVSARTAVRDEDLSFRLLHEKDHSPVEYRRFCKREDVEVRWEEVVKGYEYEKGKFVVVTDDDFRKAAGPTSKRLEILDFVPEDEIDPRFFEKPYFLVPSREAEKTYALLREAIRDSGRVGVGKITLRQRERLAAIRVSDDALVLEILRFAHELVDRSEYRFPEAADVRPQELKMARQLVENLTAGFEPERYTDDYRQKLLRIIRAKLKGKAVRVEEEEEPEATGVIDLMARLQESLQSTQKGGKAAKPARKRVARKKSA
ncbi:MAG TPA: Ku protein [Longimicrobiales bacterium]|nr:Ku protein [Longimicrobiales bacterium]